MPSSSQEQRRLRIWAWTRARLGHIDGLAAIEHLYAASQINLNAIADHCCVLRFRGLAPHPLIAQWLERGRAMLAECQHQAYDPHGAIPFREHAAATQRAEGKFVAALDMLKLACDTAPGCD